ncbi:hypothetical protein GJV78_18125 [Escherichia alba]|uniref:Uncharacterized protein n=1 Tax=Intestinirhabdus alba TaxID=2899544 RepID=A0A6L6IRX0_9ENTR|nr:hypothetical protein [Intestinirhabdus alba]
MQDNDFDNAMETVQMGHHAPLSPHCITHYRLWGDGALLAEVTRSRHSVCRPRFDAAPEVSEIRLEIVATAGALPAVYPLNLCQAVSLVTGRGVDAHERLRNMA